MENRTLFYDERSCFGVSCFLVDALLIRFTTDGNKTSVNLANIQIFTCSIWYHYLVVCYHIPSWKLTLSHLSLHFWILRSVFSFFWCDKWLFPGGYLHMLTLPETNSKSPWKIHHLSWLITTIKKVDFPSNMDGWITIFLLGNPIFRREPLVYREGNKIHQLR